MIGANGSTYGRIVRFKMRVSQNRVRVCVGAYVVGASPAHVGAHPDWSEPVRNALDSALTTIATFVPKLVLFLVILVIGFIVAKALSKVVNKLLEKVGFDRVVERGGVGKALAKSSFDASDILAKLVYYAIVLFTLQLAFSAFGPNPISELLTSVIAFLPQVFVAIIIIVVAAAIATAVKSLIEGSLGGLSYGKVLANVAAVFILGLGIIAALNQVGIATTVTTPVLVAVLATLAGVLIVGVGGGLIKPMQQRWEGYLSTAEAEAPKVRAAASGGVADNGVASSSSDSVRLPADRRPSTSRPTY